MVEWCVSSRTGSCEPDMETGSCIHGCTVPQPELLPFRRSSVAALGFGQRRRSSVLDTFLPEETQSTSSSSSGEDQEWSMGGPPLHMYEVKESEEETSDTESEASSLMANLEE